MPSCPNCGSDNRPGARFCASCGTPLAFACPACGTPARNGARFCDHCGAALDEAAAAVRTACAHLAATELEDAYLALRAAFDRLPRRAPAADGGASVPAR